MEARTMRLLVCLAERAGELVSVDELLSQVWHGVIVTPDSVYQAIASLRRQLGDDPKNPMYIATVPRLGYRMIATVGPWVDVATAMVNESPDSAEENRVPPVARQAATILPKRGVALGVCTVIILVVAAAYLFQERSTVRLLTAAARVSQPLPQKSIAVLPFLDLTTQAMNEEYFADGMTEELIGDLSRIPGFRVPAPTASFYFKGKQLPIPIIARQLNVAYILDGSVRKSGDVYRVAARLIRADNGYVAWTETYERPLGNILQIQNNIAAQATRAIRESIESQR
jgi:transcriptional activator of cad operon